MRNIINKIDNLFDILFGYDKDINLFKKIFYKKTEEVSYLWDKYEMLFNIRNHSKIVAIISLYLLLSLKPDNEYYNIFIQYKKRKNLIDILELILSSALLHDIGKTHEIKNKNGKSHSEIGYDILLKENFIVEAISCKLHLINSALENTLPLIPFIINVADKHVMHEKIVSIQERFLDLRERYPSYDSYFSDKAIAIYEKFVTFFYTENLNKVIVFYNNKKSD